MQRLTPKNNQQIRRRSKSNRSISPHFCQNNHKNKQNMHLVKNTSRQSQENPTNQSIKICLQLASHHQKESDDLKLKNQVLDYRLNEQLTSMQALKKQLSQIHSEMQNAQKKYKKEAQELRTQNQRLNQEVQALKAENVKLKSQIKSTQSIMTEVESRSEPQISLLTLAKQSRRQKYTSHYEQINFVPSVACLSCRQFQSQMQLQRENHCKQLLKFQQELSLLQKKQQIIDENDYQMKQKNECISFLFNELNKFQENAQSIIVAMNQIQNKIVELAQHRRTFKRNVSDNFLNYEGPIP